jgi:hypothetical protein
VERIARALRLNPNYDWAWRTLDDWSRELGRPEATAELAREITRQWRGDPRAWLALARVLDGPEALEERLAALERAIALNPHDVEPHDLKAELLDESGQFDEAEAACRPSGVGRAAAGPAPGPRRVDRRRPRRPLEGHGPHAAGARREPRLRLGMVPARRVGP